MNKVLIFLMALALLTGCVSMRENIRYSGEIEACGSVFTDSEPDKRDIQGEVRISPRVEYSKGNAEAVLSADLREGYPTEIYDQEFAVYRSGKGKPAGLLQEVFLEETCKEFRLRAGRFKPTTAFENEIKFDFYRMSPFAYVDYSEPFLSLDNDRLLGNWGVLVGYDFGPVVVEFMVFGHEDPILATDDDNRWARPLPFGLKYGSLEASRSVDWGARLSGEIRSAQWEVTFFNGASQNISFLEPDLRKREFDLVFPEQTSLESAVQIPVSMFNFRLGASHNWRRWHGENAGQFLNFISELEYIKENILRGGDNLLVEIGFADAWDTAGNDLFQENLGIDQIYRGGSLLSTMEYSPKFDWVFKIRSIYNAGHKSSYVSPEVRKLFFAWKGTLEIYARGMLIFGSSDDVISAYSGNDNIELGIRFNF